MIRLSDRISFDVIFISGLLFQFVLVLVFKTVDFDTAVFILFLVFILLVAIRLRFNLSDRTLWIDALICALTSAFYPEAIWILVPFVFLVSVKGNVGALLIAWSALFVFGDKGALIVVFYAEACLLGVMLYVSHTKHEHLTQVNDRLRKRVYELELRQNGLLKELTSTEQNAVMAERQRLSEMLHDDLGHELTGAHLALKAYGHLMNTDAVKAKKTLDRAGERLDRALTRLKETVHATEPSESFGLDAFSKMIESFEDHMIDYDHGGPFDDVSAHVWQNLYSTLKEGLTNIRKHARPTFIRVVLISTGKIVRLSIENDGIRTDRASSEGSGLKYMRRRYEAVGGSLSVQKGDTFMIVAVLPIRRSA